MESVMVARARQGSLYLQMRTFERVLGPHRTLYPEVIAAFNRALAHERVHAVAVSPKRELLEARGSVALGAFSELLKDRGFPVEYNLPDMGNLDTEHSERYVRYVRECGEFYDRLDRVFPGDFVVLPLAFDVRGLAPFDARARIVESGNVPIDPIMALSWLYTHHEQLHGEIVWLDTLGVEVSPSGNGKYDDTAYIDRRGAECVNLDWNWGTRVRKFRIAPYIVRDALAL